VIEVEKERQRKGGRKKETDRDGEQRTEKEGERNVYQAENDSSRSSEYLRCGGVGLSSAAIG
jgi:hypothetical protein